MPIQDPVEPELVYQEYLRDLEQAHECSLRALEALYRPSGPKRSILYRLALGRAQSLLIGLHKQELQRMGNERVNSE